MAPKKKKKEVEPEPVVEEIVEPVVEEPVEEVQYTDTSYTSASFEELPPLPVEDSKKDKKKKGKKKPGEKQSISIQAASDMFNWSEDSLPYVDSEIALALQAKLDQEQAELEKPKGKKGKKGKKKEEEEIPEFEKPKEWKKMPKKDRDAWMVARIEQWRAEKEAEKQAILAGAKEKRLTYARERNEQLARDVNEQDVRRDVLKKTCTLFHNFERQKRNQLMNKQEAEEWAQYLRCDGLPDPRIVPLVQTYLHLWEQKEVCDANELDKRCVEVIPMLLLLEELVYKTHFTARQVNNYNEVRIALRAQLSETIQKASYFLLRDLEKNLKFESTRLATYQKAFSGLRLNIWVAVKWPTRKPKPVEPDREPIHLSFPAMKVQVTLPKIIDGSCICVRAARSMIDLLSESSRSFAITGEIPNKEVDLFDFNEKELRDMITTKKQQDEMRAKFFQEIRVKTREIEAFLKANLYTKNEKEKDELDNLNMMEPPAIEEPRPCQATINEKAFVKFLKVAKPRTRAGEVNLRKYRICGGVLNLDLLTTPPQPKQMRYSVIVTAFQLPKALQPLKYQVQYRAPSPPPPGVTRTPEEIEAEIKRVETQYQKLALVLIELPQEVIWTEPPVVCQWQKSRKLWTTNYINDYKFNEDKLTVQFRTGVLWPIGIATMKYNNLPYQGWDIKPDPNSKGVLVTVTGLCVTVTFLCLGNFVRLKFIANSPTSALREHFNKPYTVIRLVQLMREAGCDFFPTFDAHNYVEGSTKKEWPMEKHNYHAMAFLSRAYNFQWSRWNAETDPRTMIMQIREMIDLKREAKLSLLYVTPQRAAILKCNEMTQEINYEPMKGFPFFPDLFTMNMSYGSVDARRITFNMKYRLVETVFDLLQELKLCSFS